MDIIDGTTFDLYTDETLTTELTVQDLLHTLQAVLLLLITAVLRKQTFKTIAVAGQNPIVADNIQDTLTVVGGNGTRCNN